MFDACQVFCRATNQGVGPTLSAYSCHLSLKAKVCWAKMMQTMETINVSFLTDSERKLILDVLHRDEELRRLEEQRVKRLKTELLEIRRKGAKRSSGNYIERSCGRCQEPLGRLGSRTNQCLACKHQVCQNCRSVQPNRSWVCSVCAKEADLKKSTGDWFYDQRVNRFSTTPGHDIVRVSLRKRPPMKKRETTGEVLLNSTELNSSQTLPVPRPRLKDLAQANQTPSNEQLQRSDTDSERTSISSSRADTDSLHSTPSLQRKGEVVTKSSPAGSTVSVTAPAPAPSKTHSPSGSTSGTETSSLIHHINPCSENFSDVDGLFKKSVRRVHKLSDFKPSSVTDVRKDSADVTTSSMGDRSKSVPGLNVDEEEEEEDIDSLVSMHRKTVGNSTTSLRSSRSTLGSMTSVYSEAGDYDTVDVTGEIVFSLHYDEAAQSLSVMVKECCGLAYADAARKKCNPYVKSYLLPDKSRQSKKKTAIKSKTINPSYNETLKYSITRSQLMTRILQLSVWHYDRFGRNAFLGEVEVPLDCHDIDSAHEESVALRGKATNSLAQSAFAQSKGELVISLKYISEKKTPAEKSRGKKAKVDNGGELHVLIKEAKNLSAMKAGGTSDSFVKGYLLPSKGKSNKKKTQVVKKTVNPHCDHTFVYKELSLEQLKGMCLELTVWDREAMSSNDFLGGVRLSSGAVRLKENKQEWVADSTEEEVSLWQKMMQFPDSWAEGTLPLRSSMGKGK
ncbi:synaptotagmin-like protein 4 isoform X1 [Colossoma macropomum]|uniref:synaptotagmin-like protein 4 isoform X1 n=1 Tax=Colossoma macropomum TaxID=42526 RepID=UPI001863F7C6|nr:synaptotagmin-like protein 4 isoform X1 [Colossoma macropomum]